MNMAVLWDDFQLKGNSTYFGEHLIYHWKIVGDMIDYIVRIIFGESRCYLLEDHWLDLTSMQQPTAAPKLAIVIQSGGLLMLVLFILQYIIGCLKM